MPDISQPVEFSFIVTTIAIIFIVIGIGIYLVKKRAHNSGTNSESSLKN